MNTDGTPDEAPQPAGCVKRRRFTRAEGVLAAVVLAIAAGFYFFTVETSGALRAQGVNGDYYNLLVDGFRGGHLYLPVQPNPRLVALADPYDPALNHDLRLADGSYYQGRYYIYFGPAPAVVLMLPYTLLTGRHLPQAAAVLVFCVVGMTAASALWLGLRRRYFPDSAAWVAPLGVAVIAFGTHVLALARRPAFWELPIAAGFAFTMLALVATCRSLHARRPVVALAFAGLFLGLAVASRPTTLLAAGLLVVPVRHLRLQSDGRTSRQAAMVGAAVFGAILLAVAWYNAARFGSPFEFGQKYQLTSLKEGAVPHYSYRFVGYNLRAYFAWPVRWTGDWPFLAARPLPATLPGHLCGEELYCLGLLAPFLWFAPAGLLFWHRGKPADALRFRGVVAAVAAVFVPLCAFMLFFFYAAERYMPDFVPALMLLALCGLLVVEQAAGRGAGRRMVATFAAGTSLVTVIVGVLASFDYHGRSMRQTAPQTWNTIAGYSEPPVQRLRSWLR